MPVIPYIRESRRLIGMYTLTGNDIYRIGTHPPVAAQKSFVDSIAIGDYMTDFHQCNNNNDFELDIENQNDISKISGPFQIPLQVFIPETLDGFLAAEKNISQSRIASAATRLQPITMLTGQAVGALAGLAVAQQQLPRYVRPENVQVVLANANARLNFFEFTDVPRGDPDWAAIQLIAVRKILVGTNSQTNYYAENRFNPNNTVSYSDAANALVSIGQMIVAPNQTALQTLAHAGIVFQGCAVPGTACLTSPVVPSDFSSALHATMALNPNNIVVSLSASSHATYTRRDFAILMMQVFKNLR